MVSVALGGLSVALGVMGSTGGGCYLSTLQVTPSLSTTVVVVLTGASFVPTMVIWSPSVPI